MAVEAGVLYKAIREHKQIVLYLRWLHLKFLVLLCKNSGALFDHLLCYVVAMGASARRADAVDEADLLKVPSLRDCDAHLPAVIHLFVNLGFRQGALAVF